MYEKQNLIKKNKRKKKNSIFLFEKLILYYNQRLKINKSN